MGLIYASIRAKDLKKTLSFYTKLLGMKVTGTTPINLYSSPADAAKLRGVADAVIVGAAFMRRVAENPEQGAPERVSAFAGELVGALAPV